MNWIQDCSISSTLECWPDKLQTCNCRSKWSVNACLSCSGKAFFRAQLNARRHKEEVLHQCVWSNSSILHLIPAAEKVKRCNSMFSGSFSLQKPAQRLKPFTPAWLGPQPGRREPSCASAWHTQKCCHSPGAQEWVTTLSITTRAWLPFLTVMVANTVHELQLLVLGKLKGWY